MSKPVLSFELLPPAKPDEKSKDFEFPLEPYCISSIVGDTSGVYVGTSDKNIYKYKVLSGET